MIRRLYVEKKSGFNIEANELQHNLRENLGLSKLESVRILVRYDIEGLNDAEYQDALQRVFTEPQVDVFYEETFALQDGEQAFAVEFLPGQFDQRADSAAQCVQLLTHKQRPIIAAARVFVLKGQLNADQVGEIKGYVINNVDSREASMEKPETLVQHLDEPAAVKVLDGFIEKNSEELSQLRKDLGLAMSDEDILFCQTHFSGTEKRNPTLTEIRLLDTYWSDHCRHTTFLTRLDDVSFADAPLASKIKETWEGYVKSREEYYGARLAQKDVCMMDMATLGMKLLRKRGLLDNLEESEEINAASIVVPVNIDGKDEEWLVMFKNETHNHPTEIEPFGGAATCLGGAIRDPLSGRSYVYQAMRVTGAGDPRTPLSETLPGKLPQRKICVDAARGYSSYGNQIGLATGQVVEIYHPRYMAKRLEVGAVVAATPRENVYRGTPENGDIIVLVGGRTGRDGIGGATGSSKEHTDKALENSAEVQKGDPPMERKLQRLFRNPEIAKSIVRCNDFGAGGISVAIGELAPSLHINLDKVSKKYDGLDGTELAISESQERMAVVLRPASLEAFLNAADAENLEARVVANVTDTGRLVMEWRGQTIVDVDREFLNSNGATQNATAIITEPEAGISPFVTFVPEDDDLQANWEKVLSHLNVCCQKGLVERFDSSIGACTVNHPFGGKYKATPIEAMSAKIPLLTGETTTGTVMSFGYNPEMSIWSPYHGAIYAVVESVAKIVAAGGALSEIRLTLQEYFERLGNTPERWGKPVAALLGALKAQLELGIGAIGGKDSMSGSFKDLDVPPTLVSFAIAPEDVRNMISPEFKQAGSTVLRISLPKDKNYLPDFEAAKRIYNRVHEAILQGKVLAAHSIRYGGVVEAISKMCFGNRLGFRFACEQSNKALFSPDYGSLILEVSEDVELFGELLGYTTDDAIISVNESELDVERLQGKWEQPLEEIYHTQAEEPEEAPEVLCRRKPISRSIPAIAKPKVIIPVFPGSNCEYDTQRAFEKAGAIVEQVVFRNLTSKHVDESIDALVKGINGANILMIPGGFSAGDEPDGSGKFIAAVFSNPRISDATMNLLKNRDGLALGICNGFQALIKLGLLPYGEIKPLTDQDPTLTFNQIGRHVSCYVRTRVVSTLSPWMNGCQLEDMHSIAVSHGEGKFFATPEKLEELAMNGQIATQYVDMNGTPSNAIEDNPNGSLWAIEGICSPDGRVLGKMGHTEREGAYIGRNIDGNLHQPIFESGVKYFQ
ncbi:MAG: phosphoribosylformylglycinamidine synthase [Opitutales bacterium]|nr:phosphoribosylformylglycinamidine synthase [Opitutales bacterium]